MRIISNAPNARVETEHTCRNCGCVFAWVPADTTVKQFYDYTGDSDAYRVANCPKCSKENKLSHA